MRKVIIGSLASTALFSAGVFANTLTFDTSFNSTGYSLQAAIASPERSFSKAFLGQPDGKIVIAGDTYGSGSFAEKLAIMRLNADGTVDSSFGTNGTTITPIERYANASKMLLQPDGKIIVCGTSYDDPTLYNMLIVRYTASGVLDTTFNQTGYRVVNINANSDYGSDVGLLPDGKIVMIGNTAAGNQQRDHVLIRFNSDGTLDSTLNGSGVLVFGTSTDESFSRLIMQNGKILLGGARHNGTKYQFLLMRLNTDGTPDTSFGAAGTTITDTPSDVFIVAMDLRPSDGKIVAGGFGRIARYSSDGILDTTFGTGGVVAEDANGLKVLPNNKILVTPRVQNSSVRRLMPDGAIDYTINNGLGGFVTFNVPGHSCDLSDFIVLSDGKVLVNGQCDGSGNLSKFAVLRIKETRTKRFLDFDGDGISELSVFRPSTSQWQYIGSIFFNVQPPIGPFGAATDIPVPADFTGDGRTDIAAFKPSTGEWSVLRSDNATTSTFAFGTSGDIPLASDFDGDEVADYAVFRPSTGLWYIQRSTDGLQVSWFGTAGDKPVPSDYDGDFKTDIAIYRPSNGEWWIRKSTDGSVVAFQFGSSSDITVQGEYTGDGKTDVAVYRPSTGEWFVIRSEDNSYYSGPFGGLPGDIPIQGQYASDAKFDYVIYRPSTNTWHIQPNGGSYFYTVFGEAGDQPLASLVRP